MNEIVIAHIVSLGKNGEGIADYQGKPLYIDGAIAGETVKAKIVEAKKTYFRAELLEILMPSADRVKPICPLFEKCGGCQIMHLQYSAQLHIKTKKVRDVFSAFQLSAEIFPCLPSPLPLGYRNKIQLPMEGNSIGLYAKSSHTVVEIDSCFVHCSLGEEIFQNIRNILKRYQAPIRYILIKTSIHLQEVLVTLVCLNDANLEKIAEEIMASSPFIKGVVVNINDTYSNKILGNRYKLLKGRPYILEKLENLTFRISSASFFQVNTHQAECIYKKAVELCCLKGTETIVDAFCGVGTLSLFFARQAAKVIGIECVADAIEDAKRNAIDNEINNAEFYHAKAENFIQNLDKIDIILLNPPRKGCEMRLLEQIHKLQPKKILYISCDPLSLARDLKILTSDGYGIQTVQPYDMFPQTMHVETLTLLTHC